MLLGSLALNLSPVDFVQIQHHGYLASRNKLTDLNIAKKELGQEEWVKTTLNWREVAEQKMGLDPD